MSTTPEQLVTIILGILGVLIQLALLYVKPLHDWYQNHTNKGLIALGISAGIGAIYFGLSCTPFGADLNIALACTKADAFTLVRAIYMIAITQQTAFLILPKSKG